MYRWCHLAPHSGQQITISDQVYGQDNFSGDSLAR